MAIKKNKRKKADKIKKTQHSADIVSEDKIQQTIFIDIINIEPNREQPRKKFDEEGLLELAESIKQFGILQPLLVQVKGEYYEIIAGERRWRAARIAGVKEIPVIIKNLTEQERMEISLIENIQRENLNPIEEAWAYKKLIMEFHLKQDEVAQRVSKSRVAVTNIMRLLNLNEKVQQMLIDEKITMGHARALLGIEELEEQYWIAVKIFEEKYSVRETEKLVKSVQNKEKKVCEKKTNTTLDTVYRDLEKQLKELLGTKVTIFAKDEQKGKVEIEYYSQDELERIIDLLRTVER